MSVPMRRESRGLVPELFDWLEAPLAALRPMTGQQIRFEDYIEDGRYVLRAELPGIDPERDVDITVSNGILTIRAERRQVERDAHRTEFRYGEFIRSIPLPPNADERDVRAVYHDGLLEVSVKLTDEKEEGRRILVEKAGETRPGEGTPREAMPGETVPGETVPGASTAGASTARASAPGPSTAGASTAEASAPEASAPGASVLGASSPEDRG